MSNSLGAARHRFLVSFTMVGLLAAGLMGAKAPTAHAAGPCDPPVHEIACENLQAGNPPSEWAITGDGDLSIQGFATQFSVNRGQTVNFKVTSPAAYSTSIYRVGWYGGDGARLVAPPTSSALHNQPGCVSVPSTGLIDCGNWAQTNSWAVPSNAVSGVYFALLKRNDTGGASHVFFVVRDDNGGSKIVFQTNDTTWQAYNDYGGNSLYVGSPAGRSYKVSYNRPFNTGRTWPQTFFWQDQYAQILFMERNGYDMSYISGVDADASGSELLEHSIFVSAGHDEYWSKDQRANVTAARDAGVHLAFFSGNEVFWKTRWENGRRTLVSYKETHANAKIDPSPEWTGTWRDPRFSPPADGGIPENTLTGTKFMVNGLSYDTITVPAADGLMRLWRNTSAATQAPGATESLTDTSLGYEWDEVPDDGTRPPGLIRLSNTTVDVGSKYLLDYGSTYGNGTAHHSLAMYRAPSSALVFSAGTIRWAFGLAIDNATGSGGEENPTMQQATVNLFADMGAQPATLQSGLTGAAASTDTTPPVAIITSPGATVNAQAGVPVVITGTATDGAGGRVGGVELSFDDGATWYLANGRATWSYTWTPVASGDVTIRARAIDDSLNVQGPDVTPPTVVSETPAASGTAATSVAPTATFSEPVQAATIAFTLTAGATSVTGTTSYNASTNTATFTPSAPLAAATAYTATVSGVRDAAENEIAAPFSWSFTTAALDASPPIVIPPETPLPGDGVLALQVTGQAGVPVDAAGVALNVTAVDPTGFGFLTVFPCGQPVPDVSNLNYRLGQTIANLVIAKPGTDGKVCIYTNTTTGIIADVDGYFPPNTYLPNINPQRILDTRLGTGAPTGPVVADGVLALQVTGQAGVPVDAAGVALNVTAVDPTGFGFLTVFPCGQPVPDVSNLNYRLGQTIANLVIAKPGTDGKVCIYTNTTTGIIADVDGYFPPNTYLPNINPQRILDTRLGTGAPTGPVVADGVLALQVTGQAGVPVDAAGVALNVTAVDPTGFGFLTVFPCGQPVPDVSNLNYRLGQTIANLVIAKPGTDGKVCIYTNTTTGIIADVDGYFPPNTYLPNINPQRILDTRLGTG